MSAIEKLKAMSIALRKERSPLAPSISFALSEIAKIGKGYRRESTDDEAIQALKKIVSNLDQTIALAGSADVSKMKQERELLLSVLPAMVANDQVLKLLSVKFPNGISQKEMGAALKAVKDEFGALVDMKSVSTLIKEGITA